MMSAKIGPLGLFGVRKKLPKVIFGTICLNAPRLLLLPNHTTTMKPITTTTFWSPLFVCMVCLGLLGLFRNRALAFSVRFHSNRHNLPAFVATATRRQFSRLSMSQQQDNASNKTPVIVQQGDVMFGKFVIPAASVFYRSAASSYAFVNLRPLVPGHVLVIPHANVPLLADLTDEAYLDLWKTVRVVQAILRLQYPAATAFNVAVQDGRDAGQSVPHAHVHVLPRVAGDYEPNDQIYTDLEEWAPRDRSSKVKLDVPDDAARRDRTRQEMADEASLYRQIVEQQGL